MREAADWNTIETAPLDDTLIIVGSYNGKRQWCAEVWNGLSLALALERSRTGFFKGSEHLEWVPTHWMPFPAAPDPDADPKAVDAAARSSSTEAVEQEVERPTGRFAIEHDGFAGTVIGHYTTLEGKQGVVLQQDGTRVVHVYGEKWLKPPSADAPDAGHAVARTEDGGEVETFARIGEWADATFGLATPQARIARAGVELIEAAEAAPDKLMEEIADVVICLIGAAHSAGGDLQAAIDAKMAINRARKWSLRGDGTGYHIPAVALSPSRGEVDTSQDRAACKPEGEE